MPGARLPFERPRVLTAMIAGATATQIIRGSRALSPAAKEVIAGIASLAPAVVALRSSELAAYHGAEHIAIGTYEHGEARREGARALRLASPGPAARDAGDREHPRDARPAAVQARGARARLARRGRGLDRDLRVDGPQSRSSGFESARQAGPRDPAPPGDGRADPRAARGRRGGPGRVPRARGWPPGLRRSASTRRSSISRSRRCAPATTRTRTSTTRGTRSSRTSVTRAS